MPGEGGRRRRRRIHFSKLYSFTCIRPAFTEEHSQIGQKGFSRVVHCNDPDNPEAELMRNYYEGNYVSTTKYNAFNFIPKALFEQFRRVANVYFLIVACFSYTDLSPFTGNSMLPPLLLVTGATMFKEALEDWQRRKQVFVKAINVVDQTVCRIDIMKQLSLPNGRMAINGEQTLITPNLFFADYPLHLLLDMVINIVKKKTWDDEHNLKGAALRILDIEVNNRKVKVYCRDHTFRETRWKKLRIGDLVKVEKDEFFPADLLLLSSSYEDGICYVETTNLDGETNLKVKQSLEVTSTLHDDNSFQTFGAVIKCEDPNENLYIFVGTLHYNDSQYPLSPQNVLLRDSKLRNTDYIYGVVIFTGHDTKVMQNATDPPSKRSKVEKKMDKIIYILFGTLILISLIGSVFFGIETKDEKYKKWYIRPDNTTAFYDPRRASSAAIYQFLRDLMLYGYLIPISLYISIEIVKVLQSIFINQDLNMYYEETDRPAHARTSNLNEELGQVHTILSDKTGTLTCNSMEFIKCSIAGTSYGRGVTEVEKAMARVTNNARGKPVRLSSDLDEHNIDATSSKNPIKGFNFRDERIVNGQWVKEPDADIIQKFFRTLAICHTVVPDANDESGEISYEAESPDEAAFVVTAGELGFEFYERTQTSILLHELDPVSGRKVDRLYKLLHVLDFSSSRKRMSVVMRNEEGQVLLLCKGADSVMFERLLKDCHMLEAKTRDHTKKYAEEGLRTLVVAYREIREEEFRTWQEEFLKAKTSLSADREEMVDKLADTVERDLILLGATAVEDKLQKGVPECIDKLAQAGIHIWVLTGDKMETAVNIGYACSLLRKEMHHIIITLDSADLKALERQGDKSAIAKASHESITQQLKEGKSHVSAAKQKSLACALIIDGNSLGFALTENLESLFLDLATDCASVICCRSSPKQKALVTRLVKTRTGQTTLAIGDGANDVGMLQEADIGVGISGVEGMQAVMTSDFAIAQFRFLERLLLVHGHWCYRRTTTMICYFFFKNVAFGFTLFWFLVYASFSGEPAYNDWFLSFYNVFFTSLPVIALGVFDQDVSARLCLKYPLLHQEGVQNILFSWLRILGWMFNGVYCSVIIFFCNINSIAYQAFRSDGRVADYEVLGLVLYTCVVWTVNYQIVLTVNYFTWIHHLFIWGSIVFWYIFLVIFGQAPPTISSTAYKVFVEACVPSALHWLTILLVVISCLLPFFLYKACEINFFPDYHHIIIHREKSSKNRATSSRFQPEMRSEFSIGNID